MDLSALSGLLGISLLLAVAFLLSNNKKAINWRLVVSGLGLQLFLAVFCLNFEFGRQLFQQLGHGIEKILSFSDQGAGFVFGFLITQPQKLVELFGPGANFIFAFKLVPTIIFVSMLVGIAYHIGVMQRIVQLVAFLVNKVMGASGAEAVSNSASIFVGQIEAQLLVKPYLSTMTRSELLAIMAGSMACISGGIMAIYIQMGVKAAYLLTASIMSVPSALVIAKILHPETETPMTTGTVRVPVEKHSVNMLDAAATGASEGLKIGLGVIGMLIGFIALIGMVDYMIGKAGIGLASIGLQLDWLGLDASHLSLNGILGSLFYWVALAIGVPAKDANAVGGLMGTKIVVNEFVAYVGLTQLTNLTPKAVTIASFALCGFANFSSVAMQIGGIGEMAPSRKKDLAQLGIKALLAGTLASYISSALAGTLTSLENSTTSSQVLPLSLMAFAILVIVAANLLLKPKDAAQQEVQPLAANIDALSELAEQTAKQQQLPIPGDLTAPTPEAAASESSDQASAS